MQLMGADGKLVSIATADIKEQRGSTVSLMPEGLQAGLSLQEFTDLTEYLATLKQPESTLASNHGMPGVIPQLAKPVTARPFFSQELKLPRAKVQTGLTAFHQVPGLSNVFLVLHQKGMIWRMEKTATGEEKTVFADLTERSVQRARAERTAGHGVSSEVSREPEILPQYQVFEEGKVATHHRREKVRSGFQGRLRQAAAPR